MRLHFAASKRIMAIDETIFNFDNHCSSVPNSKELREGGKILVEKLKKYKPLIAVLNGKCKELFT